MNDTFAAKIKIKMQSGYITKQDLNTSSYVVRI